MKTLLKFILILFCFNYESIYAQAPQAIPYQAVARNNAGNLIVNQTISLRFSIHDATAGGTVVYKETMTAATNAFGLFTVNVGQGTVVTGTFSSINWGGGSKFLQVEMDAAGGVSYVDMGTQQMLSVPYALSSSDNRWSSSGANIFNNNSGNVGVGISPDVSAKLDISSSTKGFLMPRMSTALRNSISTPAVGLQIFNTDDGCVDIYDGINWSKNCSDKIVATLIDPLHSTSNSWTQKTNFGGTARESAVSFSIGFKGYFGTGFGTSAQENDFWEYDPSINVWTQKANVGGPDRIGAAGFSLGGKGYIGTGFDNPTSSFLKDFWEYNPSTNIWIQKADFGGSARSSAVGFSIDNKGYIGAGGGASDFWEYNPVTNTWTSKASVPGGNRSSAVGFSIGHKGYVGTGFKPSIASNDFWEFDPAANTWTQKANFAGVNRGRATGFSIGFKGYIGCGATTNVTTSPRLKDFWEYDPSTNSWLQRADVGGTVRGAAAGFSIGKKGYIGTGSEAVNTYKNDFWEYMDDNTISVFSSAPSTYDIYSDGAWTQDGGSVYNSNSGYIGIGTTTPHQQLEIVGSNSSAATSGTSSDGIARFQPTGTTATLDIGMTGSPTHAWIQSRDKTSYALNYNLSLNPNGGNVGIGMVLPLTTLQIAGAGEYGLQKGDAVPNAGYLRFGDNSGWKFHIGRLRESVGGAVNTTAAGVLLTVQDNGNVGIGTVSPTQKLHVVGNICATGSIGACSDIRYKKSIVPLKNCLEKVNQINGVSYFWKTDEFPENNFSDGKQIGVIAQDLEKIIPELVITDANGFKTVDYSKLTPVLVEAIKELKAENENLKSENTYIKSDIEKIKVQLGMEAKADK